MLTRDALTAGKCLFTVAPSETFVTARRLLGEEWHDRYTFEVDRVELPASAQFGRRTLYAVYSVEKGRRVYLGELVPATGSVRLTTKSAFPAHATRVRVCRRTVARVMKNEAAAIAASGWVLTA